MIARLAAATLLTVTAVACGSGDAEPADAPGLVLGPEPLGPPQRLVLRLGERQLVLASNGLRPFAANADGTEP